MRTFVGHSAIARTVFFDGNALLTTSYDGWIIQWDLVTALPQRLIVVPVIDRPVASINAVFNDIVVFHLNNDIFYVYNLTSGAFLSWPYPGVRPFTFYQRFAATVRLYNSSNNIYRSVITAAAQLRTYLVNDNDVYVSHFGNFVGSVLRYNLTRNNVIHNYTGHTDIPRLRARTTWKSMAARCS